MNIQLWIPESPRRLARLPGDAQMASSAELLRNDWWTGMDGAIQTSGAFAVNRKWGN